VGKPACDRRRLSLGPFHQQPLGHPGRLWRLAPSLGSPDLDHAKPRAWRPLAPLPPGHPRPGRRGPLLGHRFQPPRSRPRLPWGISSWPASLLGGWQRPVWILGPHARTAFDLDDRWHLPPPQVWSTPEIVAVQGIRHERQGGHLPGQHVGNPRQRDRGLPLRGRVRWHSDVGRPFPVFEPCFGQIRPPVERTTGLSTTPMPAHGDRAVRHLAPRVPQDCRATPTECAPAVGKAVSSRVHTSDLWSRATTVRAKRRGTAATAQGFCPTHGRRACPSAPAMRPAMGAIDVRSPSSHKPWTSTCAPWARSNRVKNGLNGVPARSRFLESWPQRTSHPVSLQRELNRVLLEPSP